MIIAQSFADPSALAPLFTEAQYALSSVRVWVRAGGPETWLTMGGATLGMLWLWARRPW
jgi:hypothetical protein